MNVTHKLTADLLARGVADPVHAVQCDANTRAVAVTLTAGGVAWEPPADAAISVAFKKPDGKKGWYDKLPDGSPACSVSGNVVTAILAPEVLTAVGKVDAVIVFQDKNLNQLATFGFAILVEPNPAAGRGISNDYYAYSTMEEISQAVDAMLDSLEETKADIGQLIVQVSEAVSRAEQAAGPAIVNQASGEVLAVADSTDRPVQGLKLFGKTVQNGTPSPNAPVELESAGANGSIGLTVTGKNLLKTPLARRYDDFSFSEAFPVKSGVEYTLSFSVTGATTWRPTWAVYDIDGRIIAGDAFAGKNGDLFTVTRAADNVIEPIQYFADKNYYTTSHNASFNQYRFVFHDDYYVVFGGHLGDTSDATVFTNGQFEVGSVQTAYEPYRSQALTVSTPNGLPGIPVESDGNYTDESGQAWICDEVDFARGVYVRRAGAYIFTGNEAWELTANGYLQCALSTVKDLKIGANAGVCEFSDYQYLYVGSGTFLFMTGAMSFAFAVIGSALVSSAGLTVDNVGALTSGKKVLYELETPIETLLSAEELAEYAALHTNKPNTTVHNDGGAHMELSYVADTKLYIDQKFTALENAILSAGANV